MTAYLCNASIPRPGHTGQRMACTLPQYDDPHAPTHGLEPRGAQHWHPVGHTREANGYAWHDDTAGAIPHDPATAVPTRDHLAERRAAEEEPTGVRFTRTEVQRLIGHLGGTPARDELDDIRRLLEDRLRDHDADHDED